MADDKQLAKTTSTAAGGASSAGADVDHSPEAARKASRAGLNKAESAAQLASTSQAERTEQRGNSKQANIDGYEGAITAATKQVLDVTTRVETLARGPHTEAGSEPLRQVIAEGCSIIDDRVYELEMNVISASNGGMDVHSLGHAVGMFARACTQFMNVATGAGHPVAYGRELKQETDGRMRSLSAKVGVPSGPSAGASTKSDDLSPLRAAKPSAVTTSAVGQMATAARESIRLARMTVHGAPGDVRVHDFKRATSNLRELAALVETVDPQAKQQHRAELRAVARDGHSLFAEERASPLDHDRDATRDQAQTTMFSSMVAPGNTAETSLDSIGKAAT